MFGQNMKIILIGSDSFIASCFYESFDHKDNLKIYSIKKSGKKNEIIVNDLFQLKETDFVGYDIVMNFAAIVHQPKLNDDELYNKINTELPIFLSTTAKSAGIKHFIQMSTIAVYGNTSFIDDNTPQLPINIYGKSKLIADNALLDMQVEKFNVTIVRPPMVYGGGKSPGNMLKLIQFANKGIPLPFKDVENRRDFIHVFNLVQVLGIIINHSLFGVIRPTDAKPVSTGELMKIIKKNSTADIRSFQIPRLFQRMIKTIIPSVYEKLFGNLEVKCNISAKLYTPQFNIDSGIKELLASLK
jgi:UDP-glucose 4-epimerase